MSWKNVKKLDWVEPIIACPAEGICATREDIRKIVFLHGAPSPSEELDMIVDSIFEGQNEYDGMITEGMIMRAVQQYKIQRRRMEAAIERMKPMGEDFENEI